MFKRILAATFSLLIVLLTVGLITAAPASAGGPDKGTKSSSTARVAGEVRVLYQQVPNIGELVVYWNGYQNRARLNHIGDTYGVYSDTGVNICKSDRNGNCTGPTQTDRGNYRYFAGDVWSGPSAGSCVAAWGNIAYWRNGAQYNMRVVGACG